MASERPRAHTQLTGAPSLERYRSPLYRFFPDSLPAELLHGGRVWVCCDENKVPMVALNRGWRRAKSSDPSTWRSFDAACAAYETGRYAGVGRVIVEGEGFVGIDLDHCRSPATGAITPRAREILNTLDSYSEVSPSGTGIKVWVRAALSKAAVKPGLEVYPRGRYFTVTGQILAQYPGTVEDRSDALAEIIAKEFPRRKRYYPKATRYREAPWFDLGKFLESAHWVEVLAEVADQEAEAKYQILCPWIDEHTTAPESGTFVGQYPSGATFFWCWHAHCRGRTWRDFRRVRHPKQKRVKRAFDLTEVKVNISYG
jgi:hypothetical protein